MSDQSSREDTDVFVTPPPPAKNESPRTYLLTDSKAGMERFPGHKSILQCSSQRLYQCTK